MRGNERENVGATQLLLVGLSVYVLIALLAEAVVDLSPPTREILEVIDTCVCVVFLADFFYRLWRAPSKSDFLRWGWIDFISSVPTLPMLRWGRVVRMVRVVRVLRGVRSAKVISSYLFKDRANGVLSTVVLACVLLVVVSSISILHVEKAADSNIRTAGDALWWSLSTVTTVGYGDRFPVTPEGRLFGVALMTAGVGLFGVFTGYIASWVLNPKAEADQSGTGELLAEVESLRDEVKQLREMLQVRATDCDLRR